MMWTIATIIHMTMLSICPRFDLAPTLHKPLLARDKRENDQANINTLTAIMLSSVVGYMLTSTSTTLGFPLPKFS
jgi:hypothetical protein